MSSAPTTQPPGQPQLKAIAIAQLTGPLPSAVDDDRVLRASEGSRTRTDRLVKQPNPINAVSLPPTITLIHRILAPDKPPLTEAQVQRASLEDILPPLTSSNEVDIELYAILAVVVKDLVNTWYSKITTDNGFVEEIIQIIAHCSRTLEQRLRRVDIAALVLDEIPRLMQNHVEAYRIAKTTTITWPHGPSLRQVYHGLNQHPALASLPTDHDSLPSQRQPQEESEYRQLLIQGALAVLLPTEDLQNGPLRTLVGDIVADLIIGQALAGKVCEGWFLHQAISKTTSVLHDKLYPKAAASEMLDDAKNRLEKFGLLTSQSKFQNHDSPLEDQSKFITLFWRIMQYGYLAYLFFLHLLKEFQSIRRSPLSQRNAGDLHSSTSLADNTPMYSQRAADPPTHPVLEFGLFGMISTLLKMEDHMPWLASMILYSKHLVLYGTGQIGRLDSTLDRFLCHALRMHVLTPSFLPLVLQNLRATLFPNNTIGPPAPPPSLPEERRLIKRNTAKSIFELFPRFAICKFYNTNDEEVIVDQIELDLLDPFDDQYLNKHLAYGLLELILVRLIPELGEQSITDLLGERGVLWEVEDEKRPDDDASLSNHEK